MQTTMRKIATMAVLSGALTASASWAAAGEKAAPAKFSWQEPHAKVLPTGNLEWTPRPFVFEKGASVRYIDFDKYYAEQGGNKLIQSEPLKEDNWARAVKQAARKTATLPAPDVILGIDVDRLTPDMCGTMYAFISYCVSSAPGCKSFCALLEKFRANGKATIAKDLLEAYACADAGKWNEAWRFYVLSERFK